MWQGRRTGAKVDAQEEEMHCLDVGTCVLPLCLIPMQCVCCGEKLGSRVLPGHRAAGKAGEERGYVLGLDAGVSSLWTPKEYLTVQEFKSKEF